MRNHFYIKILLFTVCVWLYSCDKPPVNNSACPAGYEGELCDSLSYLKFIGSYRVSESCMSTAGGGPNNPQFPSTITVGFNIDRLTISNFANRGLPVEVEIYDGRFLFINSQVIGAIDISGGRGEYERFTRRINLEYNYRVSGTLYTCTAVYFRF